MITRKKRWCWLLAVSVPGVLLAIFGQASWLITSAWLHDRDDPTLIPDGFVDDASRMNLTPIAEVWPIPAEVADAETQLQVEMKPFVQRSRRDRSD